KSRNPKYSVGDIVLGYGGWQEYALSNGAGLRKLDPKVEPVSTALGVLGMPGMTAYVGLLEIAQPKPGETRGEWSSPSITSSARRRSAGNPLRPFAFAYGMASPGSPAPGDQEG